MIEIKQCTLSSINEIIDSLEEYSRANNISKITMKNTSHIFPKGNNDLLSFLLNYRSHVLSFGMLFKQNFLQGILRCQLR